MEMSAGNHLVDAFYQTAYGYEENYIPEIIRIVERERVDLIIPSTDYEVYYLSRFQGEVPCRIACSGPQASRIYLDKYLSWQFHDKWSIPFAESCLPTQYHGQFGKALAKPRRGRGSRGLIYDIQDTSALSDDEYLVQKMYVGTEITTAVYRCYGSRKLHGMITMVRSLENGATVYCRVVREYDSLLLPMVQQIVEKCDVAGAFNIQSIVTSAGKVVPFEINCRISGTNSVRSAFGFRDVQYTIEELLWGMEPSPVQCTEGVAYRMLTDVIYPGTQKSLRGTNKDRFLLF